ncbi:ArsR/SmtB family transcription factor [Lacticaseibacillus songhuajiangensis]|jgi:DNA-binding transcriptional ArsR family regulator|uniref:ArsR/SmtB family transcription factor n=1 Tax=Lacticaseibacillus songhuajiangensis TaxID=1296539 RepID=UPI000F79AAB5|nr:metalloregulator ArsR/SmtB family transcription factor [Lacticaseibacillus songhuajiangensis]
MDTAAIIKMHKALGDKTRYQIVTLLSQETRLCAGHIEELLDGVPSSTLSHHLKLLAASGLIVPERSGTFIYYTLDPVLAARFVPELWAAAATVNVAR